MESNIYNFDRITTNIVLSENELQKINGGGFAYDVAFAIRELGNYVINGGGMRGIISAAMDFGANYKPLN